MTAASDDPSARVAPPRGARAAGPPDDASAGVEPSTGARVTPVGDELPVRVEPPLDLRLAPAVVAAWASALTVTRVPPRASLAVALVCLALAAGAARTRWGATAALGAIVASAVLVAGASQVAARSAGPLDDLADDGAVASVVGRVTAAPSALPPAWPGAPPRVRWQVQAMAVRAERASGAPDQDARPRAAEPSAASVAGGAAGPVTVVGPPSDDDAVEVGAVVRVAGSLSAQAVGRRALAVLVTTGPAERLEPPPAWHAAAGRVRATITGLAAGLGGDAGALYAGVTVGDTSGVPDDLAAALRTAGLTHVTAVSGAHFTLVAGLVLVLASAARLPRAACAACTALAMAAMVLLVQPGPSVVRAAVMGLVGVLGLLLGRPARAVPALATAVVVLLVVDPWLAAEVGFVLSVAATAGLVLLGGPLTRRWSSAVGRPAAAALALPVAAQLVCGPALLPLSGAVTPWSVVANVLVAPAVAPATVLGLGAAAVAPWWPGAAEAVAAVAGAACWWIAAVARWTARLPGAQVPWLGGAGGVATLAVAGVCVLRLVLRPGREDRAP